MPNRMCWLVVAMLMLGLSMLSASATPTTNPAGTWLTANGHGVVAIAQCGDALCGRIVGIDREPTEPMPTDVDGHSQCGLTIITNGRPAADGAWLGKITDPRNGNTYGSGWIETATCICGASLAFRCSVPPKYGANIPAV